jgi:hypothetical protein
MLPPTSSDIIISEDDSAGGGGGEESENNSQNIVRIENNNNSSSNNNIIIEDVDDGMLLVVKDKNNKVNLYRSIVIIILILVTIGAAISVYYYISQSEIYQFEQTFNADSQKVFESMGKTLERTFHAIDILSSTIVSTAYYTNQSWPFVMIPGFAIHAAKARSFSDGILIYFLPIVTSKERLEWESYSMENYDWVNETLQLQNKDSHFFGPKIYDYILSPYIVDNNGIIPYNVTYVHTFVRYLYSFIGKYMTHKKSYSCFY